MNLDIVFFVNEEMEDLKRRLEEGEMETNKSNNFIDKSVYQDDYSHNDIRKLQTAFMKEAEEYLTENYKGQYVIFRDWCVHILDVDFYEKLNIKSGKIC